MGGKEGGGGGMLLGKIKGHYLPCSFTVSPAGVCRFPAHCSVGRLHSQRETDGCHTNTHQLTHAHCRPHFPSCPHKTCTFP